MPTEHNTPATALPSTREWLRTRTEAAHSRTDAAFSRFDLSCERGLRDFLLAQALGLRAVKRALQGHALDWAEVVGRRAETAEADIRAMCADWKPAVTPHTVTLALRSHTARVGAAYVAAGSLHGTGVLRRQLRRDAPMPEFFATSPDWVPMWKGVLARLETLAPCLDLAHGATLTFQAFETAANRASAIASETTPKTAPKQEIAA